MRFREPTSKEIEEIKKHISIPKNKIILIGERKRKEVFITTPQVYGLLNKLKKEVYSVGVLIGEFKRGRFLLGLGGMVFSKNKRVVVNDKAEQLVLYGRDVFPKSIIHKPELKFGEKCIIVNKKNEAIGIGKVNKDKIINLLDLGWYLRRGG
ncbi:MAG: hypothetical protein DRN25_07560 [Thermoplasmata archaeon]|nr:MAG: hypothetical protein DRN25_07560 [Thermoplasmata archaeon]